MLALLNNFAKNIFSPNRHVLGINERNIRFIYPHNDRKHYKYADNKLLTKEMLESNNLACPKTFASIDSIGVISDKWNGVKHNSAMAIKPASGSGGNGILLIKKVNGVWKKGGAEITDNQIISHIANILFGMYSGGDEDQAIIEDLIIPHPLLTSFCDDGIPDIRIITLKHQPVMAMLRLPTSKSDGKANIHQGGIGVGINLKNGFLTHAYDGKSYIKTHPDTNKQITGIQVPMWDDITELATKVGNVFPLDFLGTDIVIDKNKGPLVLEINIRPGLSIQMANRESLKDKLDTHLKKIE